MKRNISAQMHAHGFRMTPQRWLILNILEAADRHLSPVEIVQRARQEMPGLTEATVYRTLSFLTGQGVILAAHVGNGQLVYEIAEHAHHHLICRVCGATQEIDHESLKELYDRLNANTGFQIDRVHLTFFGLCPACQKN